MKDRTQNIGWIILFLITSGFIGFIGAWLLGIEDTVSYLLIGSILMVIAFGICYLIYLLLMRKAEYQSLWAMLERGCYHEVNHRIDSDGNEMNRLWELKMLACFHSGDLITFERLYREHMNEIHECKSLAAYMLGVLKDLMDALSHDRPPAVFMKNDATKKHTYQKQREYQLYYNIQQGIKEYYGTQKQAAKIYFEKFLVHTNVLSKPLGFYLYALMIRVMMENDHPQIEEYYRKAQQYVFDENSLAYIEDLKIRIYDKKGTGYQKLMDNDMNRNRRSNLPFENSQSEDSLNRSFNFDQPAFRREKTEQSFASRRHSADIQREFDEMNASLNSGNSFSLYEDDGMDMLNQKRRSDSMNETKNQTFAQEDISDDLDPTWFARKSVETQGNSQSSAFAQKTSSMSEPAYNRQMNRTAEQRSTDTNSNRNPMAQPMAQAQEPMMRTFAFQDNNYSYQKNPQTFAPGSQQSQIRRSMEEPAFINQPEPQISNQRMRNERQPINQQERMDPIRNDSSMQNYMSAQNPRMGQNMRNPQAQQAMPQNNAQAMYQEQVYQQGYQDAPMGQPSLQAQNEIPNNKKKKRMSRKNEKQDPFAFGQGNDGRSDPYRNQAQTPQAKMKPQSAQQRNKPYHTYVKHNITVFFITLLDSALVSVCTASVVYNQFFARYSQVNSDIVSDIIVWALVITLIAAYMTAGIHTGYTILKKSLKNWSPVLKIVLSPLLLVISLLIGVICEVPYLIFASIKKGSE